MPFVSPFLHHYILVELSSFPPPSCFFSSFLFFTWFFFVFFCVSYSSLPRASHPLPNLTSSSSPFSSSFKFFLFLYSLSSYLSAPSPSPPSLLTFSLHRTLSHSLISFPFLKFHFSFTFSRCPLSVPSLRLPFFPH